MTDQEINKAVARKLGLTENHDGKWIIPGTGVWTISNVPDFCHSIAAAWEVVEKMQKQFDYVEVIHAKTEPGPWSCGARNSTIWKVWQSAHTAPMAICLAFLNLP